MKKIIIYLLILPIFLVADFKQKLTSEEKEWLKNNPIIKFAADPNYMPYESFDSNGNYVGFISTYLTSLEETL